MSGFIHQACNQGFSTPAKLTEHELICNASARATEAWDSAMSDPQIREDIEKGLADAAAGRTRPWAEIREGNGTNNTTKTKPN